MVKENLGTQFGRMFFLYMNSFSYRFDLLDLILTQPESIQSEFDDLIMTWLRKLSQSKCYDDRNEESVKFAKLVSDNWMGKSPKTKTGKIADFDFKKTGTWPSNEEMMLMLSHFLNAANQEELDNFAQYGMSEHRTIQQAITRLFHRWMQINIERYPKSIHTYIGTARFPFI